LDLRFEIVSTCYSHSRRPQSDGPGHFIDADDLEQHGHQQFERVDLSAAKSNSTRVEHDNSNHHGIPIQFEHAHLNAFVINRNSTRV